MDGTRLLEGKGGEGRRSGQKGSNPQAMGSGSSLKKKKGWGCVFIVSNLLSGNYK